MSTRQRKSASRTLGRFTEVASGARLSETELGDYSYVMEDCAIWCATIGKFANIASAVRINAPNHPTWRATLHHFTYRAADYFDSAENEAEFLRVAAGAAGGDRA